jgi:hypothetical protein
MTYIIAMSQCKFYNAIFSLGVDNIKINLREIGWDGVNWLDIGQVRDQWRALVNIVLNLRVP